MRFLRLFYEILNVIAGMIKLVSLKNIGQGSNVIKM
jgi:hypothetical protein